MPKTLGKRLTAFFAVATLPLGILAGLFVSLQAAVAVFVVGWLLLTPATAVLLVGPEGASSGWGESPWVPDDMEEMVQDEIRESMQTGSSSDPAAQTDPVEELRQRYARGEIDEVELERRLDALLETEDVEADDQERIERAVENLDSGRESGTRSGESETTDGEQIPERE